MSRYRPPRKPGSPYITQAGRDRLKEEFDYLWREKRPQVTQAVSEAAAQGDRSENAEYIYGKKQLREIDSRIRFLTKRLEVLQVVERLPSDQSAVYFGAWVELENVEGELSCYRIVGADEYDMAPNYISIDSPMARALLKKRAGDVVSVKGPSSAVEFEIITVRYAP